MYINKRTGGRGTVGGKDVNRASSQFVVGGTGTPRTISRSIVSAFTSSPYSWRPTSIRRGRVSICYLRRVQSVVAHDDEREQGHDNSRATPDGVIVVAAFAVVRVGLIWVGVAVALRFADVVRVLDVLGELLGPVVRRKVDSGRERE